MAWSDETEHYRARALTSSAQSGQTVALTLELEVLQGAFPASPPRPLLIRCDRNRMTTLKADLPSTKEQLEGVTTVGAITAATATAAASAECTATFDLPAGLEGDFQLVLDWAIDADSSNFVVVEVPAEHGIFTITR